MGLTDDAATPQRVISLEVDRERRAGFLLKIDGTDQSYLDLDDPTHLEFDYLRRMADALEAFDPSHQPARIIHIGGAGMTLARYLAARRPRSPQIVLEPDVELTEYVRQQLPLPPRSGIKVRGVDGRTGVAAMRSDYADVVVLDAFDGARVPADLVTVEFCAQVADVLVEDGLFLLNLADRAPFGFVRRVLAGLGQQFPSLMMSAEPATLKGRRFGNVLLCAARRALPHAELARIAARSPFPYRVVAGAKLGHMFAAAEPFTDADSEMSPAPPGGKGFFH